MSEHEQITLFFIIIALIAGLLIGLVIGCSNKKKDKTQKTEYDAYLSSIKHEEQARLHRENQRLWRFASALANELAKYIKSPDYDNLIHKTYVKSYIIKGDEPHER